MDALAYIKGSIADAHRFNDLAASELTAEVSMWQPQGTANTIQALVAHMTTGEDNAINRAIRNGEKLSEQPATNSSLFISKGWSKELGIPTERGGQWTKGKSADTFGPIGPWLVTTDEVADPQNLKMWLEVDGHRYQNGSTKTMIFGVAHVVAYVSQFMSLQPGDVISTGTPPGVGMGIKPEPIWLKPNQTMRLGIEGLGEQQQRTKAYAA